MIKIKDTDILQQFENRFSLVIKYIEALASNTAIKYLVSCPYFVLSKSLNEIATILLVNLRNKF